MSRSPVAIDERFAAAVAASRSSTSRADISRGKICRKRRRQARAKRPRCRRSCRRELRSESTAVIARRQDDHRRPADVVRPSATPKRVWHRRAIRRRPPRETARTTFRRRSRPRSSTFSRSARTPASRTPIFSCCGKKLLDLRRVNGTLFFELEQRREPVLSLPNARPAARAVALRPSRKCIAGLGGCGEQLFLFGVELGELCFLGREILPRARRPAFDLRQMSRRHARLRVSRPSARAFKPFEIVVELPADLVKPLGRGGVLHQRGAKRLRSTLRSRPASRPRADKYLRIRASSDSRRACAGAFVLLVFLQPLELGRRAVSSRSFDSPRSRHAAFRSGC